MSGSLSALLRALHESLQRIHLLGTEKEEHERAVARLQAQLQEREKQLRQLQQEIRQLQLTLRDREVTEKQLHEKMTRWQRQIQAASTAREYQALQNQLENARIQLSTLEDEMLELMDKLERRQEELPERTKAVESLRAELEHLQQQRTERLRLIQQRMQEAQAELARLEAELPREPREFYEVYQRLVRQKAHEALAPVEHGSCMGCFTETTLQMIQDLRLNRPVNCKSCGRILYLQE